MQVRPAFELADVFRRHGESYERANAGHLGRVERRVIGAITACRTAALGGHVEQCDDCGLTRVAYNSCRNRHCAKCQAAARAEWLAARQSDLLPVPYFHVVFTSAAGRGRDRLSEQADGLRPPDARCGRGAHDARRRATRRQDRPDRGPAHIGTDADPSSAYGLQPISGFRGIHLTGVARTLWQWNAPCQHPLP